MPSILLYTSFPYSFPLPKLLSMTSLISPISPPTSPLSLPSTHLLSPPFYPSTLPPHPSTLPPSTSPTFPLQQLCLPLEKTRSPVPHQLQRAIAYIRCEKDARFLACLKHSLRKDADHFGLSLLPGYGGGSEDLERLLELLLQSESAYELELL